MTNQIEKFTDSDENIQKIKQEAKVVALAPACGATVNVEMGNTILHDEFIKAKDHSSAKLYASFSNLINVSAWVGAILAIFLVVWWCVLVGQVAYGEYSGEELLRLNSLIAKLEGIFSYLLTTALGFAGGVCKVFLNFNNKN